MIDHRLKSVLARTGIASAVLLLASCEGAHPNFDIRQYPELQAYEQEQREIVSSYAAVDEANGVYRIPVDRAIELVANDNSLIEPVVEVKDDLEEMTIVERGEYHFVQTYACSSCHALDGSRKVGPPLNNRWGGEAPLESGKVVTFNDEYFRESVLYSNEKIARGYPPAMPIFEGRMTDEQLEAIKAYLDEYQ
jgi:mono/diheme cytochrome c family protein